MLHSKVFKGLTFGITRILVPSLNIVEVGLPLFHSFFGEIEFLSVLPIDKNSLFEM